MTPTRIEIDPNALREGLVYAHLDGADGPIEVGDVVCAFEPEDSVRWDAEVVSVDDSVVALRIDASSMADDDVFDYWQGSFGPTWWSDPVVQSITPVVRRTAEPVSGVDAVRSPAA